MTNTCPQCRGERALADTCRMNGIDDFLVGVGRIISSDGHTENHTSHLFFICFLFVHSVS